jgi:hypothetical protein
MLKIALFLPLIVIILTQKQSFESMNQITKIFTIDNDNQVFIKLYL